MLASVGGFAALINYLSNPIPQDVDIKTPIALAGEVTYWPADSGVLGAKDTALAEWSTQFEHGGSYSAHLKTHYLEGKTIGVTSITPVVLDELDDLQKEAAFDAEPETLVLDDVAFDAQSGPVTIEGTISDLNLGAGWVDTAYVEIGVRPEATKGKRNAGIYMIFLSASADNYLVHLQDYTGHGNTLGFTVAKNLAPFTYKITLTPTDSTGGTADLVLYDKDRNEVGTNEGVAYGCSSTWVEAVPGEFNEDFSKAHLFYSIIADRRGTGGISYSATVGDINHNKGADARIVIPIPEGTTLGDLESISWWVYTVAGYPPHVDIYLDVDEDNELDLEDVLTAEMACNPQQTIQSIADSLPGEWVQTFESTAGFGPAVIDGSTTFWVTQLGAGTADAPSSTLANWKDGIVTSNPDDWTPDPDLTGEITADALVLRLEIEVDNWVVPSECYVDDVEIVLTGTTSIPICSFEPDTKYFTGEAGTSLDIFAGSEFYFNFDAENQANLPIDGKLEIVITPADTLFDTETDPGAEFVLYNGYAFTGDDSQLELTSDAVVTFEPVIPVYLSLHLKLKPNVDPDTYTFTAQITMP